MSTMIETLGLGRYFGTLKAVDGVSFSVGKGEVLGFLGPNGAGKSTTMKMLTCFLTPSFGTAKVCGFDIIENPREVRQCIGYLPENAPLYGEMEVVQFLRFVAEVRNLDPAKIEEAIERVVHLTTLGDVKAQRIETLSKGFKRRVGLAQALIHDPDILVLDEPTDGLDPNQKFEVRSLINSMAKDKCIVLSTHILEEVDACCTRVVVIAKGKLVADDSPANLRATAPTYGSVIVTIKATPGELGSQLGRIDGVKKVVEGESMGTSRRFTLVPHPGRSIISTVVKEAEKNNWTIDDLQLDGGQLDEVFRQITQ